MFNKNDPLIGAVQEVMKKNHAEREAIRLVNEKFGVHDRKALPHERQGEWDAAYKQVLSESKSLAALAPPHDKVTHKDVLVGRGVLKKQGDKHVLAKEEMKTDPYAEGQASSISTVAQPKKEVTPADQSALKKKIQGIMKEAKVNPYAVGMAAVKKSTGDEPPMEKKNIMKAHKIAKKIIAKKKIDEGFNGHHGLSVTASAEKQAVVGQLNERSPGTAKKWMEKNPTQGETLGNAALSLIPGMQSLKDIKSGNYADAAKNAARDIALTAVGGPVAKGTSKAYNYVKSLVQARRTAQAGKTAQAVSKTANPVSQAAREPTNVAAPKPSAAPQAANRPYSVAGAQAKAPIKSVIPKTQSGVPSMVGKSRVGPSKVERVGPFNPVGPRAPARPTTPNAAAANAARQRMSALANDKPLKGALAVGTGALAIKAAQQSYAPKTATATSTVASGPSFEKTGRGSAPSLPAKQPAAQVPVPKAKPVAAAPAPVKKAAPAPAPAAQAPAPAKKPTAFQSMMRRAQSKSDPAGTPGRRY